jgi:hypothetical protein
VLNVVEHIEAAYAFVGGGGRQNTRLASRSSFFMMPPCFVCNLRHQNRLFALGAGRARSRASAHGNAFPLFEAALVHRSHSGEGVNAREQNEADARDIG